MTVNKIDHEFLVNPTTTDSRQLTPSVTWLLDGGFVAMWQDPSETGDDTSDLAVRGQAYDADGTARGEHGSEK